MWKKQDKKKTFFLTCRYRGVCAIFTSGVLYTHNLTTYQISLFLLSAFSQDAAFSEWYSLYTYTNVSECHCLSLNLQITNKQFKVLLVDVHFTFQTQGMFSSRGMEECVEKRIWFATE